MIYLGIDTSNYKTSLAAVDQKALLVSDISEYLDVAEGQRGLRQSDAFFKHSNRLPGLLSSLLSDIDRNDIAAIGVSDKPRNVEGSYMPCFMAGVNLAKVLSETLQVPMYSFSHQEGHAAAVIEYDQFSDLEEPCILLHLSGGTSEILLCSMTDRGYDLEIAGGSKDISFGQLLDRFGVALGYPFPSGMYIDEAAASYNQERKAEILGQIACKDAHFNLSGTEKQLMDFAEAFVRKHGKVQINGGYSPEAYIELAAAAYEIMDKISDLLISCIDQVFDKYRAKTVIMAGGVASSAVIRKLLEDKNKGRDYSMRFGLPKLSGDNAVGIALLTERIHRVSK